MRVPIAGGAQFGAASNRSQRQSGATLDNFFVEPPLHQGDTGSLVSMPGMSVVATISGNPEIKGMFWPGYDQHMYIVAGQRIYKFNTMNYTITDMFGADSPRLAGSGPAYMEFLTIDTINNEPGLLVAGISNGTQPALRTGSTLLWFETSIGVATSGSTSSAFVDGRAIVQDKANLGRFYYSNLVDPTTWNALDFATAGANLDALKAVINCNRELYLLGSKSCEIWFPTGNSNAPFERFQGGLINIGCVGAQTARRFNNSIAFLSRNEHGQLCVMYMGPGYKPRMISPPGLNARFATCLVPEDSFAFVFQHAGHEFYCLTFNNMSASSSVSETWCYDALTEQWCRWYDVNSTTRHSIRACALGGNLSTTAGTSRTDVFFGFSNGNIALLDSTTGNERNTTITRQRITPPVRTERVKARVSALELEVGHVSDPATIQASTLNGALAIGSMTAVMTTIGGTAADQTIKITCDNGWQHESVITGVAGNTVTFSDPLPYPAASGNAISSVAVSYVAMAWSKDGGRSFSADVKKPLPSATSTQNTRVVWKKLGVGRDWQFRITAKSTTPIVLKDLWMDVVGEAR